MKLIIESPGLDLDPQVTALIESKFGHLGKIYARAGVCEVLVRKKADEERKDFFVEAKLGIARNMLFARSQAESPESAVREAAEKLGHQLLRIKEEREDSR